MLLRELARFRLQTSPPDAACVREHTCIRLRFGGAFHAHDTKQVAGYIAVAGRAHLGSSQLVTVEFLLLRASDSSNPPCSRHVSNLSFVVYRACVQRCVPATLLQLEANVLQTDEKLQLTVGIGPLAMLPKINAQYLRLFRRRSPTPA
jgi:hypothetical protein